MKNPMLDPDFCAKFIESVHSGHGIDCSYGGWLEDRSRLWSGHYMKPGATWHLGIDYNVPAGTEVCMPYDAGELWHSIVDGDQDGGWGGKMIFRVGAVNVIFGHLRDIQYKFREYKRGEVIGRIAETDFNGGWASHLHVQAMRRAEGLYPQSVDGYGSLYAGIENDFPRPDMLP